MALLNNVLLLIHVLAVIGILVLLLRKETRRAPHRLSAGVLHSAATALIAGVAMVGIRYPLHDSDPAKYELFNNGKIGVKLIIVLIILGIGYANIKKPSMKVGAYMAMLLLTIANIIIALTF